MKQVTTLSVGLLVLLSGCVSTPNTKALITPIGAVGIHSFAPPQRSPNELRATRDASQSMARLNRNDDDSPQR